MNEVVSGLETRILTGIPHASQALVAHLHVGGGGGRAGPTDGRTGDAGRQLCWEAPQFTTSPAPGQASLTLLVRGVE